MVSDISMVLSHVITKLLTIVFKYPRVLQAHDQDSKHNFFYICDVLVDFYTHIDIYNF